MRMVLLLLVVMMMVMMLVVMDVSASDLAIRTPAEHKVATHGADAAAAVGMRCKCLFCH
jgi:hypothetical protein